MTIGSDSMTVPAPLAGQWLTERVQYATRELDDCLEWNANKLGGAPVLRGTRISVAQILAELAEGQSAEEVAQDFDLDVLLVKKLVQGLAICLDRPVS
ncbi:MAG: DUF433 domain-containing protein [Planctomycetota bacterium]|nr:DUF433 domain-containing protein [Planctomycetota bacterium]